MDSATRQAGAVTVKHLVLVGALGALAYTAWELIDHRGGTGLGRHGEIIVYTSDSCGLRCRDMVEAIRGEGEHVYVLSLDGDQDAQDELADKLDAIGFDSRVYRLPVVDVYGEVIPDGPSIKKVLSAVRANRP